MSKKSGKIAALIESYQGRELPAHYLGYFECFNRGLFYEAHDVLEELWLPARHGPDGKFYQGLIQLAGAFVHLQKDRLRPAAALFEKAATNLKLYPATHHSLNLATVLNMIEQWSTRLRDGAENPLATHRAPQLSTTPSLNEYATVEHALKYLSLADRIPHRTEGEAVLLEFIPQEVERILDLGAGDGRLLALVRIGRRDAEGVALDFSPTMLTAARERFRNDPRVRVIEHNLDNPLPNLGQFDAIVSSFAIHHCSDERKKALYAEIYAALKPGGVFCNLEHVTPGSPELHHKFLRALGVTPADEDPSNKLVQVETQLEWLREIGFQDVDCHWKWLELALLGGTKKG